MWWPKHTITWRSSIVRLLNISLPKSIYQLLLNLILSFMYIDSLFNYVFELIMFLSLKYNTILEFVHISKLDLV